MSKYQDAQGNITEVGNPDLNPGLIAGKTLVPDTTPTGSVQLPTVPTTINSSTLDPVSNLPYKNPNPPMPSSTPVLSNFETPPATLTPTDKSIQDLMGSLMTDNTTVAGKSVYQNEQNTAQDITGKTKLVNDLTASFNNLARQAIDIPNQLQLGVEGRGVTAGGLAPIQAGELRKNSIAQNMLASQIETAKGNLTYAQQLADNAVADKYAPIEASRDAKIARLELLLKSPQLSVEHKNQAQKQLDYQHQRQLVEDKQKTEDANIATATRNAITQAQNFTPTTQYPTIQSAVSAMGNAPTEVSALQIAASVGLVGSKTLPTTSIQEYEYAKKNGYTGSFSQYQNEDANRKAIIAKAGTSGLDNQTLTRVLSVAGQFDGEPSVKNFQVIGEAKSFVDNLGTSASGTASAGDDQGLLYAFAKAMDPNSVVREGEYATVQKYSQSWATTFGFNVARIFSNSPFLSDAARKQMKDTITKKFQASETNYKNIYSSYSDRINKITGMKDGSGYITDYAKGFSTQSNTHNDPLNLGTGGATNNPLGI